MSSISSVPGLQESVTAPGEVIVGGELAISEPLKSSQEESLENASVSSRDGVREFAVIVTFYVFCNDFEMPIIYILSAPGNTNFINHALTDI